MQYNTIYRRQGVTIQHSTVSYNTVQYNSIKCSTDRASASGKVKCKFNVMQ